MKRSLRPVLGAILVVAVVLPTSGLPPGESEVPADYLKALPQEAHNLLVTGDKFILYSLNPKPVSGKSRDETFHDYRVLGKAPISDARQKMTLVNTLENGIASSTEVSRCFKPRHGIRAGRGTNVVDLLICFECGKVYGSSSSNNLWKVATTARPGPLFNDILKRSGVPLPDQ